MIEKVGKISNVPIVIMIGSRAIHSYIAPNIVERCYLKKRKIETTILVQLDMGSKRKVTEAVRMCPLEINGLKTFANLKIIPLGSYHVLIGMGSHAHHVILDYHNKTYTYLDEEKNKVSVRGIPRLISLRHITTL